MKPLEGSIRPPLDSVVLSPSSINLFIQEPSLWVLKHFYGLRGDTNIYATRGKVIEDAVAKVLTGVPIEKAIQEALDEFTEETFFWGDTDLVESLEADIPQWIVHTCEFLELTFPDTLPLMQSEVRTVISEAICGGYIDFDYPEVVVDLKTVQTLPDPIKTQKKEGWLKADKKANVLQQYIYWKATGKPVALLFSSPDGCYYHPLTEDELLAQEERCIEAIENMKELLSLPLEKVLDKTPPDVVKIKYSFYWDEPLRRAAAKVWPDAFPKDELDKLLED